MKYYSFRGIPQVEGSVAINRGQFAERTRILRVSKVPSIFIRYACYAFIFSLPFEAADIQIGIFTLSRMLGFIFIAVGLYQARLCFRLPPGAFWCFATYLIVCAILGLYTILSASQESEFIEAIIGQLRTLFQLFILFWISYNLLQYERIIKGSLLALAASCIAVAVLQLLGVSSSEIGKGQISAFQDNPNTLGVVLSIGMLALIGLAYGREKTDSKIRLLFWLSSGILAITIVRTGSRGAILALALSLLPFLLRGRSMGLKIKVALLCSLTIGFLVWASYHFEAVRERWEETYFEGDLSGREYLFAAAWEMFLEKPLLGWGPVEHYYELGRRRGLETRDPHNMYLWVLNETGLLGAIPFFIGLWLCWRAAWKARRSIQGILPLAMLFCFLITGAKGTWLNAKLFWLVLAYALASGIVSVPARLWETTGSVKRLRRPVADQSRFGLSTAFQKRQILRF